MLTCREVLKDDVIPYAIKWFTGEAQMEDSDEEYGDEDEEDEEVSQTFSQTGGCSNFAV